MTKIKGSKLIDGVIAAQIVQLLVLLLFSITLASSAIGAELNIQNVQLDTSILGPENKVTISYKLSERAKVSILIYGPDYSVVRVLLDSQERPAGINSVSWDGNDAIKQPLPDEAYLISITAKTPDGRSVVYNPTSFSGGEEILTNVIRSENPDGNHTLQYTLPVSCRTTMQAGVAEGPMMAVVRDWAPQAAGTYRESWDGMDETGKINVVSLEGSWVYLKAYQLPENSIIVKRGIMPAPAQTVPEQQVTFSPNARVISWSSVRNSVIDRLDSGISPEYVGNLGSPSSPRFTIFSDTDRTTGLADQSVINVTDAIKVYVEVAPESLEDFLKSRFEIVIYVDNKRFDEEESAYSPYMYSLKTSGLSAGEHMVTMNMVSLAGQIGTYSFKINVVK